ncbi:beta-glucosidase [Kaistia dalseonensis]|uniref:Glycoamylase-like domain-containing protein n=1 Tax=Kaistia dalseonensis TaxID=410840 RepID=A0ABU0H508_9HYPH|nr:glucoamylase family protein [Kaistia dalseonensis]MCX5494813.1 beta-glucosidase [Kaistia dalseonensis]MDQ0437394.1 hypothetical protein [Kaistia dalseonensis]
MTRSRHAKPAQQERLSDDALLDLVQRQTFRYFWDFAHPVSGLIRDRTLGDDEWCATGGTGFGVMAIIVAVERGWVSRAAAVERLLKMVRFLWRTPSYHGAFPHFLNGTTGATLPFGRRDDGADIIETALLLQGLIAARNYFVGEGDEVQIRGLIDGLCSGVEWDWFTRDGREALYWHWSPNQGWIMNHEILGWNECLIAFVLAAGAPQHAIVPAVYHNGFTQSRTFLNRRRFYDIELPLGPDGGGPLFFAHYSFLGLDPRGLVDRYADYWAQNVAHTRINYEHCVRNPNKFAGYGPDCWGLTASDNDQGYSAHAPDNDLGVITPTAALSSFPYLPEASMRAIRHFHDDLGAHIWRDYGFTDAFNESVGWYAKTHLAIDQGPIIIMIENYRSGLIWDLVMRDPQIQRGLRSLDFNSPRLASA